MPSTALIKDDIDLLAPIRDPLEPLELLNVPLIRSSPYGEEGHLLDLSRLEVEYRILASALQSFYPKNSLNYANSSYLESFNINEVIELVRSYVKRLKTTFNDTSVYIIVFRSTLFEEVQKSADHRQVLAEVDRASHLEANASGGLLKYWFGTPTDTNGSNLATCWWRNREDAKLGGGGKAHRKGMSEVKDWFKNWVIEEYNLSISNGVESFSFTKV